MLIKIEYSRCILEKYSNNKFHESPCNGSRVVPCGRTDVTKLAVTFRHFAKASKKGREGLGGGACKSNIK